MTTWVPVPYLVERESTEDVKPATPSSSELPPWKSVSEGETTGTIQMPGWQIETPSSEPTVAKKEKSLAEEFNEMSLQEIIDPNFDKSRFEVRFPDMRDKPIPFTDEEIEDIVSAIPDVESGDACTSQACLLGLKENLRYQLRREAIAPSAKNIPRLKKMIVLRYHAARVKRGTSVGVSASSNVGSSITQMSFDAFKALGGDDGGMGSGVRGMKNILYAVMNRHDPSSIIHFNILVNPRDVIDISGRIVETFVEDFIEKKEILPFSKDYEGDSAELKAKRFWWHDMYETLMGQPLPEPVYIMRLYLNRTKMYEYRVTPAMIAKSIEKEKMSKTVEKEAAQGSMFAVVYSPLEDGILDIIPDEVLLARNWAAANKFTIPFLSQLFLSTEVKPGLKTLRVGGIPGIKSITPVKIDIANIFSEYMRLNPYEIEKFRPIIEHRLREEGVDVEGWENKVMFATISKRNMVAKGLPYSNMQILAKISKIIIIQQKVNAVDKPTELLVYVPSGKTIAEHFNKFVEENKNNDTLLISDREMMGNKQWTLGEYIQALNTYTYAYTKGSNIFELLKIPWVDKRRTICNNMHEIVQIFGIESTQIYIAGSLVGVLEGSGISASSVGANSRHIMLISDFMTNRGLPYGATYSGNTRQGKGVISAASIERSMIEFLNSAPYNKTETINTAASSQWTGTTIAAGSCAGLQFPTMKDIQEYRSKIQQQMAAMRRRQESRDPEKVHLFRQGKPGSFEEKDIASITNMMRNIGGEELEEEEYMQDTSSFFDPSRPAPVITNVVYKEPEDTKIVDPDSKEAEKLTIGNPPKLEKTEIKNVALQEVVNETLGKLANTETISLIISNVKHRPSLPLPDVESHISDSLLKFVSNKLKEYSSKITEGYNFKNLKMIPTMTQPGQSFTQRDYSSMSDTQLNKELIKSVPLPSFIKPTAPQPTPVPQQPIWNPTPVPQSSMFSTPPPIFMSSTPTTMFTPPMPTPIPTPTFGNVPTRGSVGKLIRGSGTLTRGK